jgi:hypothetical protein
MVFYEIKGNIISNSMSVIRFLMMDLKLAITDFCLKCKNINANEL